MPRFLDLVLPLNGVPLTRRRDHWHTGSLVYLHAVALVGSGDSKLTGDKLLFMTKGLLKDKTHLQVGWGIKYLKVCALDESWAW